MAYPAMLHACPMARPIEPTPPITGKDAEKLLAELEQVVPPEEIARHVAEAEQFLALVMKPKYPHPSRDPNRS